MNHALNLAIATLAFLVNFAVSVSLVLTSTPYYDDSFGGLLIYMLTSAALFAIMSCVTSIVVIGTAYRQRVTITTYNNLQTQAGVPLTINV